MWASFIKSSKKKEHADEKPISIVCPKLYISMTFSHFLHFEALQTGIEKYFTGVQSSAQNGSQRQSAARTNCESSFSLLTEEK